MGTEQNKDMTGVLFINDRRENDKQPNMTGHFIVNGQKIWLSAWTNHSDNVTGGRYLALKGKPDDSGKVERELQAQEVKDDDISF